MRKDTYTKQLNPVDYKAHAKSLSEMTPEMRRAYIAGAFTVLSMTTVMANGGDLTKDQRHALDLYWQWLEMGITVEQYNRLKLGIKEME